MDINDEEMLKDAVVMAEADMAQAAEEYSEKENALSEARSRLNAWFSEHGSGV